MSKSKCTKHTIPGPLLEVAMSKKCTPLWRETHFQVKMHKTRQLRSTLEVEMSKSAHHCGAKHISKSKCTKAHHSRTFPDHFWKLRCRKSADRCWREAHFQVKMHKAHHSRTTFGSWDVEKVHTAAGAKHISKSKCTKHVSFGPLLEVAMSKKCTPLWREAHFQVKMYKARQLRSTLEVEMSKSARHFGAKHISKGKALKTVGSGHLGIQKSFCLAGAGDCEPDQKWAKREGFVAVLITTTTTIHYTTHHNATLLCATLRYTTLHNTTLHCATLHYTALNYTTLRYTTPHSTKPHYTTALRSTTPHYTALHFATLHYSHKYNYNCNYTTVHHTTLH